MTMAMTMMMMMMTMMLLLMMTTWRLNSIGCKYAVFSAAGEEKGPGYSMI